MQSSRLLVQHAVRRRATAGPASTLPCRRTFFSVPDQQLHISRTLPYSQKQLYDLVSDVNAYHRFLPFCTSSRMISRPPPGSGHDVPYKMELTVGFMGVEQSYISDVYFTPNERVKAVASDDTPIFTKLSSVWTFKPVDAATSSPTPSLSSSAHSNAQSQPTPASAVSTRQFSSSGPPTSSSPTPQTQFTLDLEFGFVNPLHAALSSASLDRVSQKIAEAFVIRCAQVYGTNDVKTK